MWIENLTGLAFLVYLAISSLVLGNWAWHAKAKTQPALLLASGFLMTTSLLVVTNLVLVVFKLQAFYYPASFAVLALAIGLAAIRLLGQLRDLTLAGWYALASAAGSFLLVGVLRFRGAPSFDSTFVLSLSHVIQSGEPFWRAQDYFKRGLAYPILHAFAQPGHFAPMITVFMAALAGLLVIEVISTKFAGLNRRTVQIAYAATAALTLTAPMVWNAALYIREHTLVALAVGVLFALLLQQSGESTGKLSKAVVWAWMSASIVVATSRPEGIAISLLFTLAIYEHLNRTNRILLLVIPVAAVSLWLVNLRFSALPRVVVWQPWLLLLLWAAVAGFAAIRFAPKFLKLAPGILFGLLSAIFVGELVLFNKSLASGLYAQFTNLVLQKGGWSLLMVAGILALLASFFIPKFSIPKSALVTLSSLMLMFLVAKTLDLGILKGQPDLGRIGIGDSLNRMWLHVLVPLVTVLFFVIAHAARPLVQKLSKGRTS